MLPIKSCINLQTFIISERERLEIDSEPWTLGLQTNLRNAQGRAAQETTETLRFHPDGQD